MRNRKKNAKSVAEKIKYYRNIKKMSQDELADASGISVNAFISDDIESINDILFLLIKLERQAHLSINGNKDGKTGADSADMPVDYDAVISDLVINIDKIN
ncbi:MAG: helix-turn-helix transcriptional regulator [Lachnospiraceae bacterium]|nr:helix-turn-helix transcriptional regulator [Lachnospiraceae bacterium]